MSNDMTKLEQLEAEGIMSTAGMSQEHKDVLNGSLTDEEMDALRVAHQVKSRLHEGPLDGSSAAF